MFRDYDLRFLIPYVILLLALTGLDIWYEIAYRTEDSWPETVVSIGQGISSAVAITFTIFAAVEGAIYMVLAMARLKQLKRENEEQQAEALKKGHEQGLREGKERGLQEGREEGRQEGREEGREEGLQEGREEGLQEGREEGLMEGREEGIQEGREEGRLEERRRWESWAARGAEARAAGQPFDEPPPPPHEDESSNHSP